MMHFPSRLDTLEISPIFWACSTGDIDQVEKLLSLPSAQEILDEISSRKKQSLIQVAACSPLHSGSLVRLLLEHNASPVCGNRKRTPLFLWSFENNLQGICAVEFQHFQADLTQEIYSHWLENSSKEFLQSRVMLLGSPASGKTTLVTLLHSFQTKNKSKVNSPLGKLRNLLSENQIFPQGDQATDGIAISNLENLVFWDFGGQEELWTTHEFFLSSPSHTQYLIVVDLAKLHVENSSEVQMQTRYWMDLIQPFNILLGSAPVILIGTHCDSLSEDALLSAAQKLFLLAQNECKLTNIHKEIFLLSRRAGKAVLETISSKSMKKRPSSMEQLWNRLRLHAEKFFPSQQTPESLMEQIPHIALRKKIETLRLTKQYLWWEEFADICRHEFDMKSPEKILEATEKLLKNGVVVTSRHASTEGFSLVVLDPEWLAKAFTSIVSITFHSSSMRRGRFTRNHIQTIWRKRKIPEDTWPQLEKLFAFLNLIVELPNHEEYPFFVPAMIHSPTFTEPWKIEEREQKIQEQIPRKRRGKHKNKSIPKGNVVFKKDFHFEQLKYGLVSQLLVRILHFPQMDLNYDLTTKKDYILVCPSCLIRIQSIFDENLLRIELFSNHSENNPNFGFLCYFLFDSPFELAKQLLCVIDRSRVFFNDQLLGEETQLIREVMQGTRVNLQGSPDLFMPGMFAFL
jgi:GTPase SAR1 family protein